MLICNHPTHLLYCSQFLHPTSPGKVGSGCSRLPARPGVAPPRGPESLHSCVSLKFTFDLFTIHSYSTHEDHPTRTPPTRTSVHRAAS